MKGRYKEFSFHLNFGGSIFVESEYVSLAHIITESIGHIWLKTLFHDMFHIEMLKLLNVDY